MMAVAKRETTMATKVYPPMRDRRDIGQVVFLSEKIAAARALNSCCIGTEATLEANTGMGSLIQRLMNNRAARNAEPD